MVAAVNINRSLQLVEGLSSKQQERPTSNVHLHVLIVLILCFELYSASLSLTAAGGCLGDLRQLRRILRLLFFPLHPRALLPHPPPRGRLLPTRHGPSIK